MEQINLFECLYDDFRIKNKLRIIELFAGYGSQRLSCKYLGLNFEHYKICEWAVNSIIAYADLHRDELPLYGTDFSESLTKIEIAEYLFKKGVSVDYNKPAALEQLKRMNEEKLRLCYNAIQYTHNLVDVSRVKGEDLEIKDVENYTYLLTYSFPCQDLSLRGKGAGMEKGSGTRSGLLWEVERILSECETKPQVLLMENVPQVHGAGNDAHFKQWQLRLEELGYQSYWQDMTAVDYGIPQSRNRCFMVSLLGGWNYKFPKKTQLKLRLKDLLESNVDEKYYLSENMVEYISANNEKWTGNNNGAYINKDIASTINTGEGSRRCDASNYLSEELPDNFNIQDNDKIQEIVNLYNLGLKRYNRRTGVVLDPEGSMTTLLARTQGDNSMIIQPGEVRICASRGRNPNNPNSREAGEHLEQRIELGPEGLSNTLTTVQKDNYVLENKPKVVAGLGEKKSNGGTQFYQQDRIYDDDIAISVTTSFNPYYATKENEKPNYTEKSLEKIKRNIVEENGVAGSVTATGMQSINHDGCQLVSLKRGYSVEIKNEKGQTDQIDVIGNYSKSNFNQTSVVGKNGISPTVTENHGEVTAIAENKKNCHNCKYFYYDTFCSFNNPCCKKKDKSLYHEFVKGIYSCEDYEEQPKVEISNLRIRKLTPKECFRLMGLKDEDIEKVMEHQTNASGYHLRGDSIVTLCIMRILSQLTDVDWKEKFKPEEWWNNDSRTSS